MNSEYVHSTFTFVVLLCLGFFLDQQCKMKTSISIIAMLMIEQILLESFEDFIICKLVAAQWLMV